MSESDREISKVGGKVDLDDDDDEEEEDKQGGGGPHGNKKNNNNSRKKKKKKEQRRGYGCERYFIKAKKVVRFPFTKVTRTNSYNWPSSSEKGTTAGEKVIGSCFCLKQPSTLESPVDSQTSDPNDSKFTFEMLRTLIEENDFYSKECNPHLDSTSNNNNFG